jgi:hypothetical protein
MYDDLYRGATISPTDGASYYARVNSLREQ